MKEIGGYLELEQFEGEEYYPNMIKLNLGRTGLLYILKSMEVEVLWVPRYLCESVTKTCEKAGYQLKSYETAPDLTPVLDGPFPLGEAILLVNYYGQMNNEKILEYHKKYKTIIVDNTQAFYQEPLRGIPTLYSLRKFFGLSDGAYVSLEGLDTWLDAHMLERDVSHGRMKHILGRSEECASMYYQDMLENAGALSREPVKQMSLLTENLLRGISYETVKRRREDNYCRLETLLGEENPLNWSMSPGPFSYPFYSKWGSLLRKKMAEKKIYIPTYWSNVIGDMPKTSVEYDYSEHILPMPCDQRYDTGDMERIAEAYQKCIEELEGENA